jgi:hypothetical protein
LGATITTQASENFNQIKQFGGVAHALAQRVNPRVQLGVVLDQTAISLTPAFSPVQASHDRRTVSTVWPQTQKPLKRLGRGASPDTRLKPGVNEQQLPQLKNSAKWRLAFRRTREHHCISAGGDSTFPKFYGHPGFRHRNLRAAARTIRRGAAGISLP